MPLVNSVDEVGAAVEMLRSDMLWGIRLLIQAVAVYVLSVTVGVAVAAPLETEVRVVLVSLQGVDEVERQLVLIPSRTYVVFGVMEMRGILDGKLGGVLIEVDSEETISPLLISMMLAMGVTSWTEKPERMGRVTVWVMVAVTVTGEARVQLSADEDRLGVTVWVTVEI
jgi:hypothetical protein